MKLNKKNILLSVENFYPRLGGGEVFVDELMCELSKKNNVFVMYAGQKKESPLELVNFDKSVVFKNIPVFNRTKIRQYYANKVWVKKLREFLESKKIDLIFTQLEYVPSTIQVAKEKGIPVVAFIQNYDHFCPFLFYGHDPLKCDRNCFKCSPFVYKLQHPFTKKLLEWHGEMLKKAELIFSDSNYCRLVLKRFYGVESVVLHPIVELDDFRLKKINRKYITFINPIKFKGAEVVLELAKNLATENFLIVGGKDKYFIEEFKKLKNVKYIPWCDDMRKVYAQTKILLVPSQWPEPFGRVVLEAQINGIPVIASKIGGVTEAVEKGGTVVDDYKNPNAWLKELKKINNNPDTYKKYSKNAIIHTKKFIKKEQIKRFLKEINNIKSKKN